MRSLVALLALTIACSPAAAPSPAPTSTSAAGTPTSPAAVPVTGAAAPTASAGAASPSPGAVTMRELPVPAGSGPHDVAPAADGGVWFTAQRSGQLGWLDPQTGRTRMIRLGQGSAPHGVIVDRDGVAWVTDSGLNAIVSVDPRAGDKVTVYPLPEGGANLNTAAIDPDGTQWFTGQSGVIGRLGPDGRPVVADAPRGRGPYGITVTPGGDVYFASLAGSYVGRIVKETLGATVLEPPTKGQGARRVWSDSKGNVWASFWNTGQVARYDPRTGRWAEWKLPGERPQAYAVFVDDMDIVWLSDFGSSAIVRFDPATETFRSFPHQTGGAVRQLHGRPGEVWGALSAFDKLIVVHTR